MVKLHLTMDVISQVKHLYDQKLYSNVTCLVNMLLTLSDNNPDFMAPTHNLQLLIYHADSLYEMNEYCKAENIYQKALQYKKNMTGKSKGKSAQSDVVSEADIKYGIYLCHNQMKHYQKAIYTLESIPGKLRTAKVSMALAKLYHDSGQERSAITCYRDVLKECPLAFEAALGLLSLGVKGIEVATLILNATTGMPHMDWISVWVKAFASLNAREFPQSISAFNQLDSRTTLRGNVLVLTSLGQAHYYAGEYNQALTVLRRVHFVDPNHTAGMDLLSTLLCREKKLDEVEKLSAHLMSTNEGAAETWVAFGNYIMSTTIPIKAEFYAQKACTLAPMNVEALLLKGKVLFKLKKFQESVSAYREALRISPFRFEAHQGLVNCYKDLHRLRDALTIATNACKQLGQVPRTLVLYASVLATNPTSVSKAIVLLEKALKQDPTDFDAICQLAQIYMQEKTYAKGIDLLKEQVTTRSSSQLHHMLADFYTKNSEHEKALEHFSAALSLNSENVAAIEGLQKVEQHLESHGSTYNMELEDSPDTDIDTELDENEFEASLPWSPEY